MVAALNAVRKYNEKEKMVFPKETVIGALADYVSTQNEDFSPMNANFGILPQLPERIKDKQERYKSLAYRALEIIKNLEN